MIMIKKIGLKLFPLLDKLFRKVDRQQIRRTKNIQFIPDSKRRRGGKISYAEWAHVIGIFQTIFFQTVEKKNDNHVLDIGCGTGMLGIAAKAITQENGSYIGLDVIKKDIQYCKSQYPFKNYNFMHFDVANPMYAAKQNQTLTPWPIESDSKDLVTALSVWTHLCEEDAIFYLSEVARVLKKKGKAVITFFYLDENYKSSMSKRENKPGRFHSTNQMKWIFDQPAYQSKEWFCPKWTNNPEEAIAISETALKTLLEQSGLKLKNYYSGNWKEKAGAYFQDILVFEK